MNKGKSATGEIEPTRRLAVSVYHQLEDLIFSGELKAGAVLTERRLTETLGVSRTPLRDALLMLEGEGLVKRRGARYLEVAELSIPEFMHILNIRRLLEPEAARLAADRIAPEVLKDIKTRLQAAVEDAKRGGAETAGLDSELHDMIADAGGNPLMASIIRDLRRRTRIFNLQRMPERFVDSCQEHIAIVEALLDRDAQRAGSSMALHIDNVKASILGRLAAM